jgi:hypothetical protein
LSYMKSLLKNILIFGICLLIGSFFIADSCSCSPSEQTTPAPAVMNSNNVPPPAINYSISTTTPKPLTPDVFPPAPTVEILPQIRETPVQDNYITRDFVWEYGFNEWTWELDINQAAYDYYKTLPRPPTRNYSVYVTHPSDDKYINNLIEKIRDAGQKNGYSEYEILSLAVAFVQSLDYTSDNQTTGFDEYPRYPIETLVDGGGDCEDTAILAASLIKSMGYGVILLRLDNLPDNKSHMAVGVKCDDDFPGAYWQYEGERYFYLETTASGWQIGQLPEDYRGKIARVFPMIPVAILTSNWKFEGKGNYLELDVNVENSGSAMAENIYVYAGFDAGDNKCWNAERSQYFTLEAGQSGVATLYLTPPYDKYTRVLVQIVYQGQSVEESYSKWFET